MYLPIVDISRHQGAVNFASMRSKGIAGLILRVSHGQVIDDRFDEYWTGAGAAGYTPDDLCVYSFVNPKRGSGVETAEATVDAIRRVTGDCNVGYMLDVESYRNQTPNAGASPIAGAAFADYLREHADVIRAAGGRVFAYSNRAYWDAGEGPRDPVLAAELEWIVPRYPANSLAAYARWPVPDNPALWPKWAFARASGPLPPNGASWAGWQFSAGYNRQGPVYGCESSDLDLNIVEADAWARWATRTVTPDPDPIPLPEDDMPKIIIADPVLKGSFFVDGTPVSPEVQTTLLAQGWTLVPQDHPWWRAAVQHRNGPEAARLYAGLA